MKVFYSELCWDPFVNPVLVCVQCVPSRLGASMHYSWTWSYNVWPRGHWKCGKHTFSVSLSSRLLFMSTKWEIHLCAALKILWKEMYKSYSMRSMFYDRNFVAGKLWSHMKLFCWTAFVGLPAPTEVIKDWPQSRCARPLDIFISVMRAKLARPGRAVTIHRARTKCL